MGVRGKGIVRGLEGHFLFFKKGRRECEFRLVKTLVYTPPAPPPVYTGGIDQCKEVVCG